MRHRLARLALLLAVAAPVAGALHAAAVDPALFSELRWRSIGPFRGGRVLAVAGVPGEPLHFYFGAVNGGVWETLDAGRTWNPIFDGQPVGTIGAIALAPSDPKTIWVGTGEADMRNDIAQGDGMYLSRDGGRSWKHAGLPDSQQIARIVVDPADPLTAWVAVLGHPYGPNAERGVFRTRDGGASWQKLLGPDENTGAIDIVGEPGNPKVLYAALWQTRRAPWSVYPPSSGPGSSVWKSTDGGDHWTRLAGGLPQRHGRVGLAVAPSDPRRVYAVVDSEPDGGLYRSDDAGATWRRASDDSRVWSRGWYFGEIRVDPSNADRLWAMNTILLRSEDGGTTFEPQRGDPTGDDFHAMWIDPADPRRQILGVDQGAIVTLNGGATWSSWHNQPTAQLYHVSVDDRFPYWVYGAQQDSGGASVPSRTTARSGISMMQFREITPGGENDNILADPDDAEVVWGGRVVRLDRRSMQTRSLDPTIGTTDRQREAWTLPLAFARAPEAAKGTLYFGNQRVWKTTDGGLHWTPISDDLTRPDAPVPPNLDPPTAALDPGVGPRKAVVFALAPSPLVAGDLWAGTDDGKVWRTRDDGAHWQDVTPQALGAWSKVGIIEASAHDRETAYLAVDRHYLDDFRPYVYRTHDGGRSWQLVASGIAPTHFVNAVREDPLKRGLLYAATERGVYVSFDDGDAWQPLQGGLPVTSVRDLVVKGDDLVIGTHGRGFYVLDDVAPLREAADAAAAYGAAKPFLYTPAQAVRVRPESFTGTPLPEEEPASANPPFGAWIDYLLPAAPREPLALTVRDASGAVVRRYLSSDAPPAVDLAYLGSALHWVNHPVTLAATPGMHRFVWPIRHLADPALADETNAFADGVWAPPGRYTVELTVDGTTLSRPLEVAADPRVALPAAAYARQHELATRIAELRARVAAAANDARALQTRVRTRRIDADATSAAELDRFQDRLSAVTGFVSAVNPSNRWWMSPALGSLRDASDRLGDLQQAVDGADADPTPDQRAALDRLQPLATAAIAAWDALRTRELPALESRLRDLGLAPLPSE